MRRAGHDEKRNDFGGKIKETMFESVYFLRSQLQDAEHEAGVRLACERRSLGALAPQAML